MNATKTQRFLVYLIDFLIIGLLISLTTKGITALIGFNTAVVENITTGLADELMKYLQLYPISGEYDMTRMMQYMSELMKYYFIQFGINAIISLVYISLYFVLLPKLWDKQTVGRLAMKVKVVAKDGSEAKTSNLLLRELVGTCLLYSIFGGTSIIIATIILTYCSGRSLVDYIGKTKLISIAELEGEPQYYEPNNNYNSSNDDDYIDAKFKEVDNDSSDNSDNDDYKII